MEIVIGPLDLYNGPLEVDLGLLQSMFSFSVEEKAQDRRQ